MRENIFKEKEQKLRRLRFIIDLTEATLMQSRLTLRECLDLTEQTKKAVLALFPDKETVYDLIYLPRFRRIIEERFTLPGSLSGWN